MATENSKASDQAAVAEAHRLSGEAAKLYGERRFDAAIPLEERALAIRQNVLGPEHPDVATSLNNLAWLYRSKGDDGKAESLYLRALSIDEKALGQDHPNLAESLNTLALLYKTQGNYAKAEPLYLRVLTIRDKALGPEHPDVATSLHNLAALYATRADYTNAEPLYQRALAIRKKSLGPNHPDVANSLHNLAALYKAKGDYAQAEPLYVRAIAISEKTLGPNHPNVAHSLNNLAELYHTKGDDTKAEPLYVRALAIREKTLGPDHPDVANSLNNLGFLYYRKGDHGKAESFYLRALAIEQKVSRPNHPRLANALNNLGLLYYRQADFGKAEPLYLRALAIRESTLGPEHPALASCLNNLASLYYSKRDYRSAEPLLQRALALSEKSLGPWHPHVAKLLNTLAFLWVAQGEMLKATQALWRSTVIEDRHATVLLATGSDEQKRAYMASLRGSMDQVMSLHVQSAPDVKGTKQLALTIILRRKGRVLDAMTDSFAALRHSLSPADRALFDDLVSVSSQYSALVWRGPNPMEGPDQHRALISDLDAKRQDLEAQLGRRRSDLQADIQLVTLAQVQAAIPANAALVELLCFMPFSRKASRSVDPWDKPRYVAYTLSHEGDIAWVDLGEAAVIDAAVNRLLQVLSRTGTDDRSATRDLDAAPDSATDPIPAARDLDRLVMQPIRRLLGSTHHLLLSPDGALNLVPFGALVDEDERYLVERYTFTYVTSGRELLRFATHHPSPQGPVVVAAPDYDATVAAAPLPDRGATRTPANTRGLRFQPLVYAAEEGRAVARKLGTEPLTGTAATETAIRQLKGPQLLHIATHGFFLPNTPERPASVDREHDGANLEGVDAPVLPKIPTDNPLLRSGLALAGANRRDAHHDDGLLTALEVSQLALTGTKLMVLSACETGVGEVHSGDGVYGLRRAMVIAGAETQVMSLWSVDDAATRKLMEAYYDKLIGGGGRSQSLREVQLAMLRDPTHAHPYYWASFIVSGNPAPIDAPRSAGTVA